MNQDQEKIICDKQRHIKQRMKTGTWHGPFFSPDFEVLTTNEIYQEKENEFDVETPSPSKEIEDKLVTNASDDGGESRVDVMTFDGRKSQNFVPVEIIKQQFTARQIELGDWDGKGLKLW